MKYTCREKLLQQGNRYFIMIPFNVWEVCGQKGMIPVKVVIDTNKFECKLVPKGKGMYYIPIPKAVAQQVEKDQELNITFEILAGLTRINQNSPYTLEHPIRKINSIQWLTYPKEGYCGQLCIAMLTGLSIDEIIEITQARAWQCSFSKIIEALDYFGIAHSEKMVYTRGSVCSMPTCCIVNVKDAQKHHYALYFKGTFYDTNTIIRENIIGYLEIYTDA